MQCANVDPLSACFFSYLLLCPFYSYTLRSEISWTEWCFSLIFSICIVYIYPNFLLVTQNFNINQIINTSYFMVILFIFLVDQDREVYNLSNAKLLINIQIYSRIQIVLIFPLCAYKWNMWCRIWCQMPYVTIDLTFYKLNGVRNGRAETIWWWPFSIATL